MGGAVDVANVAAVVFRILAPPIVLDLLRAKGNSFLPGHRSILHRSPLIRHYFTFLQHWIPGLILDFGLGTLARFSSHFLGFRSFFHRMEVDVIGGHSQSIQAGLLLDLLVLLLQLTLPLLRDLIDFFLGGLVGGHFLQN